MAYGLEDLTPHIKKLEKDQQLKVLDRLRLAEGVGSVMSELQADPKWAIYGNHLEELKQRYKLQQEGAERLLLDGKFMNNEEYGRAKLNQAECKGMVKGIELALSIAKELIESGEKAAGVVAQIVEEK
jgi:hypothetical protein